MKKKVLLGLGACALALGGVAALAGGRQNMVEAKAVLPNSADIYVQVNWEHTYVYAYETVNDVKEEPFGAFPGTEVSNVTTCANFNSNLGGIAKVTVPYSTLANSTIIVNKGYGGYGNQSGDQTLNAGYYYWNTGSEGNQDAGKAAKVVYDFDKVLGTVSTICSGSGALASKTESEKVEIMDPLYSEYLAAKYNNNTVKGYLDKSLLTLGNHGLSYVADTTFKDVLNRNGYTYNDNGTRAAKTIFAFEEQQPTTAIFVPVLIGAAIVGVGASIIVLRKRKERAE